MMNRYVFFLLSLFVSFGAFAQTTSYQQVTTQDPKFDKKLKGMLDFTVPVMSVEQLDAMKDDVIILDAREKEEYEVSHIPSAMYIGYDHWEKKLAESLDRNKPVVLYCSIGYRSEKLGEKLEKMGFSEVYNLYGSIFEWANQGLPLVDSENQPTKEIHCYNKKWSIWMENPQYQKVW